MPPQCTVLPCPAAAELELVADAVPVDESCFPVLVVLVVLVGLVMVFVPRLEIEASEARDALDFAAKEVCLARAVDDMGHVGALSDGSSESQGLSSRRL